MFLFSDTEAVRWSIHSLLKVMFMEASVEKRRILVKSLWGYFNLSTNYGRRGVQYTDLLGYFTIKSNLGADQLKVYGKMVATNLNKQLHQLATHSNAALYSRLSEQLSFGGFYLESQPCLACNTQQDNFTTSRITTIKSDAKFTTRAQIWKLQTGHEIQKINLKINDAKRSKQLRSVTVYYTTRTSIPIIELKNSPWFWLKARTIDIEPGQTEVNFTFPVPIKATYIINEFTSFYDSAHSIPETLPCPRCSASVQTNPGICGNCGENVFQCHKCRSINYDERDPYLCTMCGYCRYAKFEWSMTARPCTTADPVDSEEERRRAELELRRHLEKADQAWKKLSDQRNQLEVELTKFSLTADETLTDSAETSPKSKLLAEKYTECKSSFSDITSTVRAVIANRQALLDYERKTNPRKSIISVDNIDVNEEIVRLSNCYGCAVNGAENSVLLMRALSSIPVVRDDFICEGMVLKLLESPVSLGSTKLRRLVRRALCRLVRGSEQASKEIGQELRRRIIYTATQNQRNPALASLVRDDLELLKETLKHKDIGWEARLKTALAVFMEASELCKDGSVGISVVNGVLLPCLEIIQQQTVPTNSGNEGNVIRLPTSTELSYEKWQDGDPAHQFSQWNNAPNTTTSEEETSVTDAEKFRLFLMQKYVNIWRSKTRRKINVRSDSSPEAYWLPRLLFCQWSQAARKQVCDVMLGLASSRKNDVVRLMSIYLEKVSEAGEAAVEYLDLFCRLITTDSNKFVTTTQREPKIDFALASSIVSILGDLLLKEIARLEQGEHEMTVMSSNGQVSADLRLGSTLEKIVKLLLVLVSNKASEFGSRLIQPILRGYLSLCRLVLLRTKAIEDAQSGLLKLLESLTSGSEDEIRDFVRICFKTLSHFPEHDFQTPQFVFERLCGVILPDDADDKEFRVQLDKDPLQEEYLSGRMVNNPYRSTQLGPTMRDIKNKICRDTELIALLEDDNGMELLVNNKIVHLDLKLADVYKKIWLQHHESNVPMRIIYRMRGLLGEATEEFIER